MRQFQYLAVLVLSTLSAMANAKIMNCVYDASSYYRPGRGKFTPDDIDASKCTHVSYAYFGMSDSNEIQSLDTNLGIENGLIEKVIDLKKAQPNLKVVAIVGGPLETNLKYSNMASDEVKRQVFIQSTVNFLQQHKFDGLQLHWQDPTQGGGSHLDKVNFGVLTKELKAALSPLNLEFSIAVTARIDIADKSYDASNFVNNVDYVTVLTNDLADGSDGFLGLNAPLRGQGQRNVEDPIKYWMSKGIPALKLLLTVPLYGHTFQFSNTVTWNPGYPCAGPGRSGPYTLKRGFLGYNELCTLIPSYTQVFGDTYGVPYMYNNKNWISYDNNISIHYKLDFMNEMGLAGVMLQSLDTDDFTGECGENNILLHTIAKYVAGDAHVDETTEPEFPTQGDCTHDGFFVNESDCQHFHQCANNIRYDFTCGEGSLFNTDTWTCVWPQEANCKNP